jgi:hypothetical protein
MPCFPLFFILVFPRIAPALMWFFSTYSNIWLFVRSAATSSRLPLAGAHSTAAPIRGNQLRRNRR